jgi:hypothetical protein
MSAHLTYRPREGAVFAMVAGKAIRLVTLRGQAGMDMETWRQAARSSGTVPANVADWNKTQEFRVGKWATGAIGNRLTVADNAALEIYDYPGEYAQRFDGVDPGRGAGGSAKHGHYGRVVWVKPTLEAGFPRGGFHIHGPPPCANPRCIVILQDWDLLFQALKTAGRISLVVEL